MDEKPKPAVESSTEDIKDLFYVSTLFRVVKTVFLILTWVCLGLSLEISGPTMQDLILRTGTNYEEVSRAISGRSAGFFTGAVIGGFLVDKLRLYCDLMIGVSLVIMSAGSVAVPWSPWTGLIWFIFFLQGTCEGVINIAGQKLILSIWGKNAASPLHVLHTGFGVGSMIVPLIANPFLANIQTTTLTNTSMNITSVFTTALPPTLSSLEYTTDATISTTITRVLRESRIEYAYLIVAILVTTLSLAFFVYQWKYSEYVLHPADHETESKKRVHGVKEFIRIINPATCADGNFCFGLQMFILLSLHFFNAVGGERLYGKFIRSYAIDQLNFSGDEASYLNVVFWISFSVGRFSGFIVAHWVPVRFLIIIEAAGVLISAILLNIWGHTEPLMLWIFTQPMAFFIAPLFPSGIALGDHYVEMSGLAITVLLLGGSIGGIAYLFLIGYLYENFGPSMFMYNVLGYAIAVVVMVALLSVVGHLHGDRYQREDETERSIGDMKKMDKLEYAADNPQMLSYTNTAL
ncbi:sodium-dependent glucose transporter 1A-like [Lingula anatina]|uniref:Sodium-dependent glucose transporter 1A-like n=1 Tax=Lingula anatina TaxID=7574 RepID=A0A1S3JSZ7_LINAN|nr:sodium-dependent glucose transporter 1A-like [Lingula anatina]|eukprot:XP_013413251.1 sodium-dependent glucose transporter 1A-like [Lingula anatina]